MQRGQRSEQKAINEEIPKKEKNDIGGTVGTAVKPK